MEPSAGNELALHPSGVTTYTDEQRRTAVAGAQRYGFSATARQLATMWGGNAPGESSIRLWATDERYVATDSEKSWWDEVEATRRSRWHAEMDSRVPDVFAMVDRVIARDEASKFQSAMIGAGIMYDKLFGVRRDGSLIGHADNVQLMVVQPAVEGGRAPRIIDSTVVQP